MSFPSMVDSKFSCVSSIADPLSGSLHERSILSSPVVNTPDTLGIPAFMCRLSHERKINPNA